MLKRLGLALAVMGVLLPLSAQAKAPVASQQTSTAWQVYTVASGLREWPSYAIAPDGRGGVWVGHVSGGRGIYRQGGLSHIRADGSSQVYIEEPFQSCSSVDDLAATPDGGVWLWLSGWHDYGQNDFRGQSCLAKYGVKKGFPQVGGFSYTAALGYIGADGVPQMVPQALAPAGMSVGLAVDADGHPWVGTTDGAAQRQADGTWIDVKVWTDGGATTAVAGAGQTMLLGSNTGEVARVTLTGQVTILPRPSADSSLAVSDLAAGTGDLGAIVGRQFYRWDGNAWNALPLPIPGQFGADEQIYGQHVAFTGNTYWVGAPQYGLFRLDGANWTPVSPESTPLPSSGVYDLTGAGPDLLIATERGAARLDTSGVPPDSSAVARSFDILWQRTNRNAQGSWVWGPRAWAERYEGYSESFGGYRFVRYYDKARMEVTHPEGDQNSPWYVTNGLLVTEMVQGRAQFGDDPARNTCPYFVNGGACPSITPVAGDVGIDAANPAPSYGAFRDLLAGVEQRGGARVSATLEKTPDGGVTSGEDAALATAATTLESYDDTTRHNIPRVFWAYMRAQPTDWLYSFGHPITEPYWVRASVGGVEKRVLVQLFERRTLTYTPGNAEPWQVEMGNVGQHYYQWRYGAYERPPWES